MESEGIKMSILSNLQKSELRCFTKCDKKEILKNFNEDLLSCLRIIKRKLFFN